MKIDTTEQERLFYSLSVCLSTFVSTTFAVYEQEKHVLIEEIKKLQEENKKLKEENKVFSTPEDLGDKQPQQEELSVEAKKFIPPKREKK